MKTSTFNSKAQRRYMWNNYPKIALQWENKMDPNKTLPDRADGKTLEERIELATQKKD